MVCKITPVEIYFYYSYIDSLNEPSPYDMIPSTDVVPDLLMFSKPLLDLSNTPIITVGHSICTDSGSAGPNPPTATGGQQSKEINTEVLRTMTEAMSNLTTICTSDQARDSVRDSLSSMMTNEEGNK